MGSWFSMKALMPSTRSGWTVARQCRSIMMPIACSIGSPLPNRTERSTDCTAVGELLAMCSAYTQYCDHQFAAGVQLVDHPQSVRLLCRNSLAGHHHLQHSAHRQEAWKQSR